jgi:uncharacterized protein with HEPN domain
MPSLNDEVRLRHLRDAAHKAVVSSDGKTRADLDRDELLRLALTKPVEIVGEAAKQISETTRSEFPLVPWSAVSRMRDRLIHHYFDIDLDILWATVREDMPALLEEITEQPDHPP